MLSGRDFLNALERIRYPKPKINKLKGEQFDYLFNEEELLPFLECFCSLTEENVLTDEELQKYNALTSEDIAKIKEFELNEESSEDSESKQESEYLQKKLNLLEEEIQLLQADKETLQNLEKTLCEKKFNCEDMLENVKLTCQKMEQEMISEIEIFKDPNSLSCIIEEIATLFKDNNILPQNFLAETETYLQTEKSIIEYLTSYLEKNFKQPIGEDGAKHFLSFEEEFEEMLFLKKAFQVSETNKIISKCELKKMQEIGQFYQNLVENEKFRKDFDLGSSQLKLKLIETRQLFQELKHQEKILKSDLICAIKTHTNYMGDQIINAAIEESSKYYQDSLQILKVPLNALIEQRARLELFFVYLDLYNCQIHEMKSYIQDAAAELENDKLDFIKIETSFQECSSPAKIVHENQESIFLSLYKILLDSDKMKNVDLSNVTLTDILKRIEFFQENKLLKIEQMDKLSESRLIKLEAAEKDYNLLFKILQCQSKDFPNWKEMEQEINISLNKMDCKLSELKEIFLKFQKEYNMKKKIIESNNNLALSRRLFVYALTNQDIFQECIQKIKLAIENSNEIAQWRE